MQRAGRDRRVRHWWQILAVAALTALGALPLPGGHIVLAESTERVSVSSDGDEGDGASVNPSVSADGTVVAFESTSSTLVVDDTNMARDIFVFVKLGGLGKRISVATDGTEANGPSFNPIISGNGRFVVFQSDASNLVPNDTNGVRDTFVHDLQTGETKLVTGGLGGLAANGQSTASSISRDGRYVAFASQASNLVTGDGNGFADIFLRDLQLQQTTRLSVGPNGIEADGASSAPVISGDGNTVVFESEADNLITGSPGNGTLKLVAHDRLTGENELLNVNEQGVIANATSFDLSVSNDGRHVAFATLANNLVGGDSNGTLDVVVRDRLTGEVDLVSSDSNGMIGNGASSNPVISDDGRYVAFQSSATNLVPDDAPNGNQTEIFVKSHLTGSVRRAALSTGGTPANASSSVPSISGDGRYVAFQSGATNLVSGDGNGLIDVFLRDLQQGLPISGTATLQGRMSGKPMAGHSIASISLSDGLKVNVGVNGAFALNMVQDGTYTITACAPGYLCAQRSITVMGGVVQSGLPPVQLPAGDMDHDGSVDIADVVNLIARYGDRPPDGKDAAGNVVDVNGDGVVNLRDLSLTLGNFGKVSPMQWPLN